MNKSERSKAEEGESDEMKRSGDAGKTQRTTVLVLVPMQLDNKTG